MSSEQLVLEPSEKTSTALPGAQAGVKTILLHVQNDDSLATRVDSALSLARACGAHLSCVHITPVEAYVAFDSFGGVFIMNDVIRTIDEEAKRIRNELQEELRNEDVSWDYEEETANVSNALVRRAALADFLVTGRDPHKTDFAGPAIGLLGELLHRSRTPLFIPGDDGAPIDTAGTAVIAWNGSYEAANAIRASVGLLQLASQVQIVQVREPKDDTFPSTKLLEYLSRRGIHAELTSEQAPSSGSARQFVSAALVAHTAAVKASYLVMGGYGHSRAGELLFGGVTRDLLSASPVSLVIAH